jgi:hypothetical protein
METRRPSLHIYVLAISYFLASRNSLALEDYVLKPGDCLSCVLQKKYPEKEMMGELGSLKLLKTLNPSIKNPDLVFPGQTITLPDYSRVYLKPTPRKEIPEEVKISPVTEEVKPVEPVVLKTPVKVKRIKKEAKKIWKKRLWVMGQYGIRYNSLDQVGNLGDADVGVLNPMNYKMQVGFGIQKFNFELDWEKYSFSYLKAVTNETQIYSNLNFTILHNHFLLSLRKKQIPIIYSDAGDVTHTPQDQTHLGLGLRGRFKFKNKLMRRIELRGIAHGPLAQSFEDSNLKSSSLKGYGLEGQSHFFFKLKEQKSYRLDLVWSNQINWLKVSQMIDSGASEDSLDTTFSYLSSYVGLRLDFK